MARRRPTAGAVLGFAVALLPALPLAAGGVEVRYAAGLFTDYVWRGITLTDDPVFQPSVTLAHANGISAEVWGNADLGDDNDTDGEINEARLVLDYGRSVGAFELGAGFIEYLFPNTPFPGSREVYLRAAMDAAISPKLELYYDFDEIDGAYARFTLTWRREIDPRWSYDFALSAGYADAAFAIGGQAGLHDGNVEFRLKRTAGAFAIHLLAGWTGSLDSDVLLDQPADLWSGLTVTFHP